MSDSTQFALDLLGYHPKWLEHGLVDADFLQVQVEEFTTSDDQNTEHYRYGAFWAILRRQDSMPDDVIDHYIELAELDADSAMAGSAVADLIHWRGLTEQQRERLSLHPSFAAPFLQKGIIRSRLLRRLKHEPLTAALFEECLAEKDGVLQRAMLEASSIARDQLENLAEHGANRAVRNIAAQRLQQKRKHHVRPQNRNPG